MAERILSDASGDPSMPRITRRRFLRDGAALPPLIAALFAATVTVSCNDSGSDSTQTKEDPADEDPADTGDTPPADQPNDGDTSGNVSGVVSLNHGHTCVITAAELTAGAAVMLTLTSNGNHLHTLSLTMTEVQNIALGTQVIQTSSVDGTAAHSHAVTFH